MGNIITLKPYTHNTTNLTGYGEGSTNFIDPREINRGHIRRNTATPNYSFLAGDGAILTSGTPFEKDGYYDAYDENYQKVLALNVGTKDGVKRINISTNQNS